MTVYTGKNKLYERHVYELVRAQFEADKHNRDGNVFLKRAQQQLTVEIDANLKGHIECETVEWERDLEDVRQDSYVKELEAQRP